MTGVAVTTIGGPTALIEIDGWRILTDPTFDAPGERYGFGFGTSSRKLLGPAIEAFELLPIDVVLLSHDQHGDNLDSAGRALLSQVPLVITTHSAARRLGRTTIGATAVRGLAAGESTRLERGGLPSLTITATPCRHGPPLSRPLAGEVIGFAVARDAGDGTVAVWVSGDTVLYSRLRDTAARMNVDVALVHLGGVRFPVTGPLRYSMTATEAAELIRILEPLAVVPVHVDGWSHFVEGELDARAALAQTDDAVAASIRWLVPGERTEVS